MQQRRLRLGDILDDYCPRERRITNHVVVAMIDDEVKQTRCTTCDADHEYKQGKAPAPRRRKPDAALAGDIDGALRPRPAVAGGDEDEHEELEHEHDEAEAEEPLDAPMIAEGSDQNVAAETDADVDDDEGNRAPEDDGPVHRRLIRATLPRQEGQVPERKPPEFTVRQPGGRGGGGREFDGNKPGYRPSGAGPGGGRGRRPMRTQGGAPGQPSRFGGQGGPRQGPGQGQRPPGNRPGGHPGANRGGGRPPGQGGRGPGGGGGRKRGR